MTLRNNETGISRVLLLVGAVLIGGLIVLGIFLMGGGRDQKKSNQSNDPYLTITEWGVRFPLSIGNRDMYYQVVQYQGGIGEGIKIYSKDFNDLKNANSKACGDDRYPLLVVNRVSASKGLQMNNPHLPDYDPWSGPYKTYNFQKEYAFGTGKDDQTLPPCVNLNAGTNQPFKGDKAVAEILRAKKAALTTGFGELQAVPQIPEK